FGEATTGSLLLSLIFIISLVSLVLGMKRYLEEPDKVEEDKGIWNKINIFYITLLIFVILAFISFWGISYPAFIQITQGIKVNVASDTKNFFNLWSYPFTILLLLALGFCLNYKESKKEAQKKTLFIVAGLSIITMFLRTDTFYVLDHNSPFWVSEPPIYKLIGSISVISIFPSLIYATAAIYQYFSGYMNISNMRVKMKGIGIAIVHIAVIFTLIGAIISSNFTYTNERINMPLEAKGILLNVGDGYGIKVVDYSTRSLVEATYPGTAIAEVLADPSSLEGKTVTISGKVTGLNPIEGHGTLVELTDNSGSMGVVFPSEIITLPDDLGLTVTGSIFTLPGFDKPVLSPIAVDEFTTSGTYQVQSVQLEVYQNGKKIGSGVAEYLEGKGGSGTFPMIDPSLALLGGDVYVIFQGISGGTLPLTLKIIPTINLAWIGIILFAVGIIMIMAVKSKPKGRL
ncbi:MAG: hypothetical protein ACNA7I_01085, partial [Candidatus Methanoperedens sp.]